MEERIDYRKVAPQAIEAMMGLENYVHSAGIEFSLLELVKYRISQINGCAYCMDKHTKDARAAGETEQRLYCLSAWREAPFYTERERAALAWAESVTLLAQTHVPDDVFEHAKKYFSDVELVNLTMAVIATNSWNRLAASFRKKVGTYVN